MNARAKQIARHLNRVPEILRCALHTRSWLPLTARYVGLHPGGYPFTATFSTGSFEFQNLADLATWWQIFYRKIYPVEATDRVIIDAGANIGAFTLYALEKAPQATVIAIEPFPSTFVRLRAAIEHSPFYDRVELINAALSASRAAVAMQDGPMPSQFRRVLGDSSSGNGASVAACTLPEVLTRVPGEIDFLKMDIEGSEYIALLNSPPETIRAVRRVAMELHPLDAADAHLRLDLFRHLESAGFKALEIQDHGDGYGMAYFLRN